MPDHQPRALPPATDLSRRLNQELLFASADALPEPMPPTFGGRFRWVLERSVNWTILILAVVNLILVFFDFTYLEARQHYKVHAPALVTLYDPVKGIEPHRVTEAYMLAAERTFELLRTPGPTPEAQAALADMRQRSQHLVQENVFADAGLQGIWVQARNRMRRHMHLESSSQALQTFWSEPNMTQYRLAAQEAFYHEQMRPLIDRNYYRAIGENGRPYDDFWKLDLLFIPIFLLEFVLRGFFGIRARRYRNWAMFGATRWYDLVYFVPLFGYAAPALVAAPLHLVRFVSVAYRMQRLGLINPLVLVQPHTDRAVDLVTDLVNIKLLTNYQESILKMDVAQVTSAMTPEQRDALARSIDRSLKVVVEKVLPKAAPEIEALIARSVNQALDGSPAFQMIKRIPLLGEVHTRLVPMMVAEVMAGAQAGLLKGLSDAESRRLAERAIQTISTTLIDELSRTETEMELKEMAVKLLEAEKRKIVAGG